MGFCFSCCRRRSRDEEREPLLPTRQPPAEALPPAQSFTDKAADTFAALRAGKLPSQDQANATLRKALRSDILDIENVEGGKPGAPGQRQQYGPLSERGKNVLKDLRELIEAVIQFGMEKNDDDRVQDVIYQNSQIPDVPIQVDVDRAKKSEAAEELEELSEAIPSSKELNKDAHRLSDSLLTLSRLLLTSSTFRFLLSDVLLTFRSLLADAAADVGRMAHTVEIKAENVEQAVRPNDTRAESSDDGMEEAKRHVYDGLKDIGEESRTDLGRLGGDAADRLRESVVHRLQKVLDQAQESQAYKSALRTLIYLLTKYAERANIAASAVSDVSNSFATATPLIAADPHLTRALTDLRILLERLASGRSLSLLISHLENALGGLTDEKSAKFNGELREYFQDIGFAVERALSEPGWATSERGHRSVEQLYDRGQALSRSNPPWAKEASKTLDEVDAFINALASDRTTHRVIDAVDKLSRDTIDLFQSAAGVSVKRQRAWREELKTDLIGWVLPRALNMLKTLPLPRVELKSRKLEVVVDALVLSAGASFLPDHTIVQNWSELRLEASAAAAHSVAQSYTEGVHTATRTRVHIDGLRISAHRIGYYVHYIGPLGGWISWEDNGLMSVDVGRNGAAGEGVSVDIELETIPDDEDEDAATIFRVNEVKVDVRGLRLSIDQSRHWILNKCLLQPLAGPVIRQLVGNILASHIRAGLEVANEKLVLVKREAMQRSSDSEPESGGKPGIGDYWEALCTTMASSGQVEEDTDTDSEASELVETDTQVTLKGVVRTTRTQVDPESSTPPTPSETLVAVGVGAQILPGKGGPQPDVAPAADQARGAISELEDAAGDVAAKAKTLGEDALGAAVMARENLEEASMRMEAREGLERRRKGWRSRAFDI